MGNVCPSGFTPAGALQCVVTCPTDKGLDNRTIGPEARCVYRQDTSKSFVLKTAPMVSLDKPNDPTPTMAWIQTNRASVYPAYKAAQDDFTAKSAVLLQSIAKDQQVADAFKALQDAENSRDQAPAAYQAARTTYYTLTKGQDWLSAERARLLNAEVIPQVSSYIQSINDVTERKAQQDTTKAVVGTVQTKLISLKDDFRATTATLTKQVDALKNQIELEKRRAVVQQQATYDWLVNLLLVVALIAVVVVLVRRVMRPAYTSAASTGYAGVQNLPRK